VLVDDDARPGVSTEMAHLHVVSARHDVEAAVSPSVPDWREEHAAVGSVGREDGDKGTLEQPVEVVGAEALSHAASLVTLGMWSSRMQQAARVAADVRVATARIRVTNLFERCPKCSRVSRFNKPDYLFRAPGETEINLRSGRPGGPR
jgi:hypothetical protein